MHGIGDGDGVNMDELTSQKLDHGFIVDNVRPPQSDPLAFLGEPRTAPFDGEPVRVLRGHERIFGPMDSALTGAIAPAVPRAADASGLVGQAMGHEDHNPMNILNPDMTLPVDESEFAAKVQKCWPKVMRTFISMMDE